jgi:hypothetical protein
MLGKGWVRGKVWVIETNYCCDIVHLVEDVTAMYLLPVSEWGRGGRGGGKGGRRRVSAVGPVTQEPKGKRVGWVGVPLHYPPCVSLFILASFPYRFCGVRPVPGACKHIQATQDLSLNNLKL